MKRLQRRLRSSSLRNESTINANKIISDKNDASSKRCSPSPQSSVIGTSVSTKSGIGSNNNIKSSSINGRSSSSRPGSSITSQDDRKMDLDQNLAEKTTNPSMGSSSSLFSFSEDSSTFSNGLSMDQDSFVVVSTTGLSSVDNSINSFYSYNPFTGKHGRRNQRRSNGEGDVDFNVSKSSKNMTPQQQQQNYLHTKKRTSHLPRLTIPSCTHTKAFLQKPKISRDKLVQKQTINISPQSSSTRTIATEPISPRDFQDYVENDIENDIENNSDNNSKSNTKESTQEFPTNPLDSTPEFHILETSQLPNQNGSNLGSSFSSNIYKTSTFSRYGTSSCSSSSISGASSKQFSRENKMMNAAIAEKEFWERELRETVNKYGPESVETSRQLNNLGSALLRCKVSECIDCQYSLTCQIAQLRLSL